MLRDQLKFQGTIYLPEEDLQDALKEDRATQSLIKTGGIIYNKEEEEGYCLRRSSLKFSVLH